ncbi:unnamed protein product [Sphenostylis stenocarpa]|uniref:Uncharacterized protein n=1 Tax=Sphenostylis stenocarpa TaxID=92480 RepID=A0AA86RXY1_9FABA|nr:unnamed protein product [Sphenostylis stenocarpa]
MPVVMQLLVRSCLEHKKIVIYVLCELDDLQEQLFPVYFRTTLQQTGRTKVVIHVYLFHGHGWLDGNMLTGPLPDFTGCMDLKIIHLENNQLTGVLPSSLVNLPSLRELYLQNNMLSGTIPSGLLSKDLALK